jgi:hypothetical protein
MPPAILREHFTTRADHDDPMMNRSARPPSDRPMYRTVMPTFLFTVALLAAGCEWTHLQGHFEGELESTSTLAVAKAHKGPQAVDLKRDGDRVELALWGCTFTARMTGTAEAELVEGQRCDDPLTGEALTWTGRVGTNRNAALLDFELEGRPDQGSGSVKAAFRGRRP